MATGDGNGWVRTAGGTRHWGLFGACGLVLLRRRPAPQLLLQLRSPWTHHGGSWGLVGGARDSHEIPVDAALREAGEEAGIDRDLVTVLGTRTGLVDGAWSYTYVLAMAGPGLRVGPPGDEGDELRWTDLDDVPRLPLHADLAAGWAPLRAAIDAALGGDGVTEQAPPRAARARDTAPGTAGR